MWAEPAHAATRTMAQESEGSAAEDKVALLTFRAPGDPDDDLASWDEATEPCGAGWDSYSSGWAGVKCDAEGGRVTGLNLTNNALSGTVPTTVVVRALLPLFPLPVI